MRPSAATLEQCRVCSRWTSGEIWIGFARPFPILVLVRVLDGLEPLYTGKRGGPDVPILCFGFFFSGGGSLNCLMAGFASSSPTDQELETNPIKLSDCNDPHPRHTLSSLKLSCLYHKLCWLLQRHTDMTCYAVNPIGELFNESAALKSLLYFRARSSYVCETASTFQRAFLAACLEGIKDLNMLLSDHSLL